MEEKNNTNVGRSDPQPPNLGGSTRDNILSALRHNVVGNASERYDSATLGSVAHYDMPDLSKLSPITFADPVAEFIKKTTTTAGAKLIEMQPGEDVNIKVREAYPDFAEGHASQRDIPSSSIASNIPGVTATVNPDIATVEELEKVDIGVIEGKIGVAENACIWVPQQMKEKAVCFASQRLVILLRRSDIVNNMHEAYDRIATSAEYFQQYKFGTFISGPSKTADIEGALVYGAQAARAVAVVLVNS